MKNIRSYILAAAVLLSFSSMAQAQGTRTVSGTVVDDKDAPLPGVVVAVSGTTKGTITDFDGRYSISVAQNASLDFSCLGYTTQTVNTGTLSVINVKLEEEAFTIEETVVVGYGTQRKVDLTGSVDQIGSDVFASRPNSNVTQMLEGAIPNLNISLEDGKPMRSADFNIRGTTSIGQGGSALILIDGVEGDPATLNPDDIASVSVLKDAASASIYGSRAPYGVVLITTKNASKEKVSVTYSNNFTFAMPVVKPDFVTDGFVWASKYYEGYFNMEGDKPTTMNTTMPFTLGWLNEYRTRHDTGDFGTVISDGSWGLEPGQWAYFPEGTDWFGLLYKDYTFSQTHNISLSGSLDKFDYYLSGRIYRYYGLYDSKTNTDDCKSENLRLKIGYKPFKWLKLTNNFEIGHDYYDNPRTFSGAAGNIWGCINASAPVCQPLWNPDGTMTQAGASSVGSLLYGSSKSVYEHDNIKNTTGFTMSFFDDTFTVNGDFTYKLKDYNGIIRLYPDLWSKRIGVLQTMEGAISNFTEDDSKTKYLSANAYADYTNTFGKHYFKALVGYNYEQSKYNRIYTYNTDVLSENVDNINLTFGTDSKKIQGTYRKWRSVGFFFRVNYSYDERYLVQVNGRYDGSSKFPANERWAFFPSVSAGWRITQEPWVKPIGTKWLSNAKIRFSYGSLGNSNIDPYYYDETFGFGNSRLLGGTIYRKTSDPDPVPTNLTWEKSTTYNGGIDLGFFNDRLSIVGDIYMRKTKDMFTDGPTIQAVYGADSPKGNFAELTTKGFELTVIWKDSFKLAQKPFNYTVKATLADYVSKIDKFNNDTGYIGGRNVPEYYAGMTIGELWGFECNGLWQYQEDIDNAEAIARAAGQEHYDNIIKLCHDYSIHPGDMKIEDLNRNGYIDRGDQTIYNPGDRRIIGNSEPRFIYSFTLSGDWNNFYASIFFQGVGKQDYITGGDSGMVWGQYNRGYNQIPKWQEGNYWTEDNRDAWLPRYTARSDPFTQCSRRGNTRYMLDVSYIRLKNILFGYNLPQKWVQKIHLSRASIFFSGENLWDWSPMYKYIKGSLDVLGLGTDPENHDTTAGSGGCYPIMASYSFGINLTF